MTPSEVADAKRVTTAALPTRLKKTSNEETGYHWEIPPTAAAGQDLPTGVTPLIGRILWNRQIRSAAAIEHILHPKYQDLHRPDLYLNLDRAVERLIRAIRAAEQITVYGDYDADGICATAIVVETLQALGAKVDWYLPSRTGEGYGLHAEAIETIAKQGTRLLVTVDCGTTNVGEIAHSNSLGLEVIVLDHHQAPPVLPEALAIINPFLPGQTYPFQGHASGGVAFTAMRGLLAATEHGQAFGIQLGSDWEKWLLDLVAISTVADLMPLTGENRLFVNFGLQIIRRTRRPGLQALARAMATDLQRADEVTIGYRIGPRLNAAGRLQHAGSALQLLLTKDQDQANQLAAELDALNVERQKLTEQAVAEAWEQIASQGEQRGYVAYAPHWSPGIIGLIAGRLVERVWRPVLVMTANGDQIVGSGRSIPGVDITAHLRRGENHFERFGGHAGACGFTLANSQARQQFIDWFQSSVEVKPEQAVKSLMIDTQADLSDLTPEALDQLTALSPFGVGHPRPRLLISGVNVVGSGTVGKNGTPHLRLAGRQGAQTMKFIGFRLGARLPECAVAEVIDLVVEASWNEWNGRREPQCQIIDFRKSA